MSPYCPSFHCYLLRDFSHFSFRSYKIRTVETDVIFLEAVSLLLVNHPRPLALATGCPGTAPVNAGGNWLIKCWRLRGVMAIMGWWSVIASFWIMELHRGVTARPRPHPASLFNDQANLLSPGAGMIYFTFLGTRTYFCLIKNWNPSYHKQDEKKSKNNFYKQTQCLSQRLILLFILN